MKVNVRIILYSKWWLWSYKVIKSGLYQVSSVSPNWLKELLWNALNGISFAFGFRFNYFKPSLFTLSLIFHLFLFLIGLDSAMHDLLIFFTKLKSNTGNCKGYWHVRRKFTADNFSMCQHVPVSFKCSGKSKVSNIYSLVWLLPSDTCCGNNTNPPVWCIIRYFKRWLYAV